MKKLLPIVIAFCFVLLNACNYSITLVHTEGQASDVVDETASNTPSTNLSLPLIKG